jgi:hypothetical protein
MLKVLSLSIRLTSKVASLLPSTERQRDEDVELMGIDSSVPSSKRSVTALCLFSN